MISLMMFVGILVFVVVLYWMFVKFFGLSRVSFVETSSWSFVLDLIVVLLLRDSNFLSLLVDICLMFDCNKNWLYSVFNFLFFGNLFEASIKYNSGTSTRSFSLLNNFLFNIVNSEFKMVEFVLKILFINVMLVLGRYLLIFCMYLLFFSFFMFSGLNNFFGIENRVSNCLKNCFFLYSVFSWCLSLFFVVLGGLSNSKCFL